MLNELADMEMLSTNLVPLLFNTLFWLRRALRISEIYAEIFSVPVGVDRDEAYIGCGLDAGRNGLGTCYCRSLMPFKTGLSAFGPS
jgi:hypothetical protein